MAVLRWSLIRVAVVLHLGLCGIAAAQTSGDRAEPSRAPRFDSEVVVTPERGEAPRDRVPASTVVLDAESLPALPVTDLGEIASFLPGFTVVRPHFHTDGPIVSARGFFGGGEAEYLRLLVDGMPVSDVESGLIDWSVFPVTAVRRVEAVRGPAASLYGDSAIGGVIHLLTDRSATGGVLTATAGSFATFGADGSYGRRAPRTGFLLAGSARRTAGALEHSRGRQYAGMGALDGGAGRLSWRWSASGDTRTRETPGAVLRMVFAVDPDASDPLYADDRVERHRGSTALTLRYDGSRILRPTARVHLSAREDERVRTIPLAPGLGDTQERALSASSFGISLEGEATHGAERPLIVRVGLDALRETLDTSYRPAGASVAPGEAIAAIDGVRRRTGLFASSAFDAGARVRLSGAIRWDEVDDNDFEAAADDSALHRAWTARGGVVVSLSEDGRLAVFSQVSRAFKAPTLEQIFDPRPYPDFAGGTFTISNRMLRPQRATNVEAGVTGGSRVRWSLLAYHMDVDDEIDFDLRTFSYANIGQSRHRGLEIEANAAFPRVQPSVTYAFTHVTAGTAHQLKNVPRHVVSLSAHVDLDRAGVFLVYRHAAGAFLDDGNAFTVDGPSSLDARLRHALGRHLVFLDVLNVTDNRYEEYGFTLADFDGAEVPFVYAGAPRALRAGVTLRY